MRHLSVIILSLSACMLSAFHSAGNCVSGNHGGTCILSHDMPQHDTNRDSGFNDVWKDIDFSNVGMAVDTTLIESTFIDYVKRFPTIEAGALHDSVTCFLDAAARIPACYDLIYELAGKYLGSKDSPYKDDGHYIIFLRHASECMSLGEADRERAAFRLEMAEKNRMGQVAADFAFEDRDGISHTVMESLGSEYTVLVFYDPDCNHCGEVLAALERESFPDGVVVMAIDAEEDRELWDHTKMAFPEHWTIGFALDPVQDEETYVFPEMPALYLLDNKGTILLKDATLESIINKIGSKLR